MWESIALVSSGITLVAFIGAVAAWLYRARIQQSERLIRTAPLKARTRLVEQALESFRIDASGLTKQQQYNLALIQIKAREIRFRTTAIVIVIIAIVFAVVTVLAMQRTPNPIDETDRAYEERFQKLEEAVSKIEESQTPLDDVRNVDSLTVEQDIQEKVNVYENDNIPWIDEFAIIIDAGHGGSDPGAIVNLMSEKQITLALAREIKNALSKKGINSRLTRDADTDVSVSERIRRGFFYRNSLAIGLHVNAFSNENPRGYSVYYYNEEGKEFADYVANFLEKQNHIPLRSVMPLERSGYLRLMSSLTPTILLHLGFITNPEDAKALQSESVLNELSELIADAVFNFSRKLNPELRSRLPRLG